MVAMTCTSAAPARYAEARTCNTTPTTWHTPRGHLQRRPPEVQRLSDDLHRSHEDMQRHRDHLHQRADDLRHANGQRQRLIAHLQRCTARETQKVAHPAPWVTQTRTVVPMTCNT